MSVHTLSPKAVTTKPRCDHQWPLLLFIITIILNNIDKPLNPSSEWFEFKQLQSKGKILATLLGSSSEWLGAGTCARTLSN